MFMSLLAQEYHVSPHQSLPGFVYDSNELERRECKYFMYGIRYCHLDISQESRKANRVPTIIEFKTCVKFNS